MRESKTCATQLTKFSIDFDQIFHIVKARQFIRCKGL